MFKKLELPADQRELIDVLEGKGGEPYVDPELWKRLGEIIEGNPDASNETLQRFIRDCYEVTPKWPAVGKARLLYSMKPNAASLTAYKDTILSAYENETRNYYTSIPKTEPYHSEEPKELAAEIMEYVDLVSPFLRSTVTRSSLLSVLSHRTQAVELFDLLAANRVSFLANPASQRGGLAKRLQLPPDTPLVNLLKKTRDVVLCGQYCACIAASANYSCKADDKIRSFVAAKSAAEAALARGRDTVTLPASTKKPKRKKKGADKETVASTRPPSLSRQASAESVVVPATRPPRTVSTSEFMAKYRAEAEAKYLLKDALRLLEIARRAARQIYISPSRIAGFNRSMGDYFKHQGSRTAIGRLRQLYNERLSDSPGSSVKRRSMLRDLSGVVAALLRIVDEHPHLLTEPPTLQACHTLYEAYHWLLIAGDKPNGQATLRDLLTQATALKAAVQGILRAAPQWNKPQVRQFNAWIEAFYRNNNATLQEVISSISRSLTASRSEDPAIYKVYHKAEEFVKRTLPTFVSFYPKLASHCDVQYMRNLLIEVLAKLHVNSDSVC